MIEVLNSALLKVQNIKERGLTIYDNIEIGDHNYWLTSAELEALLNYKLIGNTSLQGLPNRTRSKIAKGLVCTELGYSIPKSFQKCQPRFKGQKFDTYVQKSNNLQIWNEEIEPSRRYVLIRVDEKGIITKFKVVTGNELAILDTTGTLTKKYQARLEVNEVESELISSSDTEVLSSIVHGNNKVFLSENNPTDEPDKDKLLSIEELYILLKPIVGVFFKDVGHDQERNRGGELHKLVCKYLGYPIFYDNGQFPDVKHQLLEVKLQTSPTIDLGLVAPNSEALLDMEKINGKNIRSCDVRYALFYGTIDNGIINIKNFYLTTGKDFFSRFPQFGGKVINGKIQIPLPPYFFSRQTIQLGLEV